MTKTKILPRSFYERDTEIVAKDLLGKYLVRKIGGKGIVGKISETEAYIGPQDLASHSRFGKTTRNAVMFGPAGFAYVYMIYGMYYCLNISTEEEGFGSAVLIRALESVTNISAKTNGPGLLCRALSINLQENGVDLTKIGSLYIEDPPHPLKSVDIIAAPRVGVDYAKHWKEKLLRFYIKGSQSVSKA